MRITDYAVRAEQTWNDFVKADNGRLRISRYFHLRPTNSGITVVTTLNNYEMRGVPGIRHAKALRALLEKIDKNYDVLVSIDDEKKENVLQALGFLCRSDAKERKLEEKIQATMINTMSDDKNLAEKLETGKPIRFIASELIFEKGKHRVDIVGSDDQDVYFFELKKDRTTAVRQVKEYIEYYSKKEKNVILRQLLASYPINSVKEFGRLIGIMVMEYAENSVTLQKWQELAKTNGIRILFYKPSLTYENVA